VKQKIIKARRKPEGVMLSFSGGKDSTALLLECVERGIHIDRIINFSCSWDWEAVDEQIAKVEDIIKRKIERVSPPYPMEYYMLEKVQHGKDGKAKIGWGWPSFACIWCRGLKIQSINRAISGKRYLTLIGINYDERGERTGRKYEKKGLINYPLIRWKMGEMETYNYCKDRGLNFGGLYEMGIGRIGCWCCPMASKTSLWALYKNFPEKWALLKSWDQITKNQFRMKYVSVQDLEDEFKFVERKMLEFISGQALSLVEIRAWFRWILKTYRIPSYSKPENVVIGIRKEDIRNRRDHRRALLRRKAEK